jgi:hypothetical protein
MMSLLFSLVFIYFCFGKRTRNKISKFLINSVIKLVKSLMTKKEQVKKEVK